MKSFLLAALVILAGTFILNSNATQQTHDTYQDLPTRAEVSQLDKQFDDLVESIASDVGRLQKQIADLPDELAALQSRDNAFDERLKALESKCQSCNCETSTDVSAKVQSQAEMLTRLLGRVEKLEGKSVIVAQPAKVVQSPVVTYSSPAKTSSQHWTYPGDITTHLQRDHGVVVNGSIEDQLNAHDALHEGRSVTRSVTRAVQSSSCPGGVCPASGTQSRPRLFFRR